MAEARSGVVINADSAQVYRDLHILSARPTPAEEARAPHRLYGYRDGANPCSAADWAADARAAISEAHDAGRLPILVGGTGLYLRTLLEGIAPIPPIDVNIRGAVRAMAVEESFRALEVEDPGAAARLRPTDTTRVARALEVVRSTGTTLADWQQAKTGGIGATVSLSALVLLPPRPWLYARCDARFAAMIGGGGLEEAERLIARGLDPQLPVMRAIGVRETAAVLEGSMDRDQATERGQIATRQYAKRQYTWFANQPPQDWARFTDPVEDEDALERALAQLVPG